jgi:tetratricopeptide (TPR) repeat protein
MYWALFLLIAAQFDTTFRDGLLALNRNDLTAARSQLEAAATLEPKDARVWLALAQTYGKLGETAQARDAAGRSAGLTNGNAVVLRGLETFYFELSQSDLRRERFADALETVEAGRKVFDRSEQLALAAGVAYYGLRRFPEAIDAFLRTVELDPAVEQPYLFLGRMTEQAEDRLPRISAAFAVFQKRAPESYLSNFLLGKTQGSEALLRKSIALRGDFQESHFELGVVLERERKYDEAAREFARAAELKPADAAPHYHLARLYDRLGKRDEAARERATHARLTVATSGMGAGVK